MASVVTTTTTRVPPPHPGYVPAKPERVRINGVDCVEIDGSKWVDMLQMAEFFAKGKRL